jgi:uncharacterized protein involved in cysteine biosynthesis
MNNVRNPVRTLKIAAPLGLGICAVLYLLANVAYFSAATKVRTSFFICTMDRILNSIDRWRLRSLALLSLLYFSGMSLVLLQSVHYQFSLLSGELYVLRLRVF